MFFETEKCCVLLKRKYVCVFSASQKRLVKMNVDQKHARQFTTKLYSLTLAVHHDNESDDVFLQKIFIYQTNGNQNNWGLLLICLDYRMNLLHTTQTYHGSIGESTSGHVNSKLLLNMVIDSNNFSVKTSVIKIVVS